MGGGRWVSPETVAPSLFEKEIDSAHCFTRTGLFQWYALVNLLFLFKLI
jgi:hypothetical protein